MVSKVIVADVKVETIVSKKDPNKSWEKLVLVCDTMEQPQKKIVFEAFGTKADEFKVYGIQRGAMLTVNWNPRCTEYNGRWFVALDIESLLVEGQYSGPNQVQNQGADLFGSSPNPQIQNDTSVDIPNDNPFGPPDSNENDGLPF